MSIGIMHLDDSEELYSILKDNIEKYKDLSERFDCNVIDLDIYYEHRLYEKDKNEILNQVIEDHSKLYSYLALYNNKPVCIAHGIKEETLDKILEERRLTANSGANYGIWFTEIGTGYCWECPKYINILYTRPTLRIVASVNECLSPAIGCIIACAEVIDLNEVNFSITDKFDDRVNIKILYKSLGLPLDARDIKRVMLRNMYK